MAMVNRRDFLKGIGCGALALAAPYKGRGRISAKHRPNVVLINVDDLGWTDVACFGSRYYETPNIDRLASLGVKFTSAYAGAAVCSPTRASLMTGRYPARIGITDWIHSGFQLKDFGETLPPDKAFPGGYYAVPGKKLLCPRNPWWMELEEVTLAEILKTVGYVSCHIGKWHLGPEDWYPERQGFDFNIGGCDFGQPPTYFDPYFSMKHGEGEIPTLNPRRRGEYLTDREADEACRFIRESKGRPFFLHMAHYAVHTPLEGREDLVEKYRKKSSPTAQDNPVYAAMVESVDRSVGKILEVLEKTGLMEKTLLIFTSDNGGLKGHSTDNAPLRSGKGYPYEGGIRIPQIICWPGVTRAGMVCDTPVCSIDFFPTLCEAADIDLPKDRVIDGESLIPLLKGGDWWRDSLYWHFPHYRGSDVVPYSIIRSGDWKLIKRYDDRPFELFNLREDLGEARDLSDLHPAKVKELDVRLSAWLRSVGAKLPRAQTD